MQFKSIIVAALAVAQASASTIFTQPNFQGLSTEVPADSLCHKLTGEFHHNVRSLIAGETFKCEIYLDPGCENLIGTYYESEIHLGIIPLESIRCLKDRPN